MSIIIDLIIVGILVLCILLGYKKGLTKCVIKILSFVIAIIIAAILFKPVSNFVIDNTQIDESIESSILNLVKEDIEEDGKVKEDSNLPNAMVEYINKTVTDAVETTKTTIVQEVAKQLSTTTINIGVAILLFILVRIALAFISGLSSIITDLPIIKQFDKAGGIIYGILKGLIIIFVIFALISFISPLIEQTGIIQAINKSFIGGSLYNNNIILKMIF